MLPKKPSLKLTLEHQQLVIILNQFYLHTVLSGQAKSKMSTGICPFCCSKSKKLIGSHIWPKCLLEVARQIHNEGLDVGYLHTEDYQYVSPKNLCMTMLCSDCESDLISSQERSLKRHYLYFCANPRQEVEFKNYKNWFQCILIVIMVRGILVNCNLLKETKSKDIAISVWDLFEFAVNYVRCGNKFAVNCLSDGDDSKVINNLLVFLVPNELYMNLEICPAFERHLRSPQFTALYDLEWFGSEGIFFYMQFDCLHVVYPLCSGSRDYFKKYTKQKGYSLSTDSNPNPNPNSLSSFPGTPGRKRLFPAALLGVNLARALSTTIQLANLPPQKTATYSTMLMVIQKPCADLLLYCSCNEYQISTSTEGSGKDAEALVPFEEKSNYENDVILVDGRNRVEKTINFEAICTFNARQVSILRFISRKCRLQPHEAKYLQEMNERHKLLMKLDELREHTKSAKSLKFLKVKF